MASPNITEYAETNCPCKNKQLRATALKHIYF